MATKRVVCCLCFLFFLVIKDYGQPTYKIENYSTEQGLSHRRVNCMVKDREGFMWLGTWDGINRFDGHSFVTFKPGAADQYQLRNSRIGRIVEDQCDHLWIQAYDYQIYRFDKKTEQFLPLSTIIRHDTKRSIEFNNILYAGGGWVWLLTKNAGIFCISQASFSKEQVFQYHQEGAAEYHLPSDSIHFFNIDKDNRVWIGTQGGLVCLEPSTAGNYTISKTVATGITAGSNLTAYQEEKEYIYFGTAEGNLLVFDKKQRSFSSHHATTGRINALLCSKKQNVLYASSSLGEIITFHLSDQQVSKDTYHPVENLSSLYEDQAGGVWVEPEKSGAIRFDPLSHSFQLFSQHSDKVPDTDMNSRYFWLLEDPAGAVWVNMKGGGLAHINPASKTPEYTVTTSDGTSYPLPDNVTDHYYDKAGILWLTTNQGGVVKIVTQNNHFQQLLFTNPEHPNIAHEVRGMFCDTHNRLWLGMKRGNLVVTQNGIPVKGLFVNEPAGGLEGIYAIVQDSRGNIWMGAKGNGLFKATPLNQEQTKFQLTHFAAHKELPDSLPCNQIHTLLEDNNGRIWIGSLDNGLAWAEERDGKTKFTHLTTAVTNHSRGNFQNIRNMCADKDGNIWIATTSGLLVVDAHVQDALIHQYKVYNVIPGDMGSLGNNDIIFIYRDRQNRMWLATSGGGFCQAMGNKPLQDLRFRNYTTRDGMPNNYVLSCTEDADGNFWLATENGLSRFNPQTQVFRNYDSHDGLPTRAAFSEASVARQQTGRRLFFGTTMGYLSFDPSLINGGRVAANIAFTALQINNDEVGPKANDRLLKEDVNYVSELTLPYNQNSISIYYALLDHRGSGDQQGFAYRLNGFDTTWHNDWQVRKATYTNLPPGHYVFEVKALSADLYSNTPFKQLAITIHRPWWKTWWAYLLYAIVAGALTYVVWRYALAMMHLRNKVEVEQKLAALKMNFFTNVSHELRTPLTLIVSPLEQLSKQAQLSPELHAYLEVSRKNADRMVRFVNQLLDLRKVQSEKAVIHLSRVEIVDFVKKVSAYFTEAAKVKHIQLEVVADVNELFVTVDAEKLDVVIYNLIGNAIKFTPEQKFIKIYIQSIAEEQSFSIAVYDQGCGVPAEKLEAIFELFQEGDNVKNRALKGTGIGLALSREFILLHGGKIWAENNADGGLTVSVTLKTNADKQETANAGKVDTSMTAVGVPGQQQLLPAAVDNDALPGEEAALVLLVEDNDELRAFIKAQLSAHYRVETAHDGEEGLRKALHLLPDLIVSDIMMPNMDGIQMLDKIKHDVNTSHIPVVLLSARYSVESQIEGLRYGADYYITKPFHNDFLIASINNLLQQRRQLFEALMEKKKKVEFNPEPPVITNKDELFLKNLIQVVEANMDHPDFNIDTVAETMALSRTNFYKKFKSLTTLTPMEFVRDMRLQRAKQYLDTGEHNISEVAYLTGFSNPKYFSTCFKEKYQVSPSDYMKTKKA
ncbi:Two component regulator propeller [Filimonas lacunae]|uniref:histidine kinase n=3 Tax=Filimonas lacunae TaxID=477680 RepID=A0A1N7QHL1_9BACT|nr:Two component regulator propeller [Filimonas lacunae]